MRFCVLSSGSSGNSMLVDSGNTRILIDAGISCKATAERLSKFGYSIESVDAICVSHDHSDHINGLRVIEKKYRIPLYATEGTCVAANMNIGVNLDWNVFMAGEDFSIGDFKITPFRVPHDTADPVGFVIDDGRGRLGVATDLGEAPDMVTWHLRDCDALVLEFNHDKDMLWESDRAWSVKNRISQRKGHLSNEQAADVLERVASPRLKDLFLAHMSAECNRAELAGRCAAEALRRCRCDGVTRIHVTSTSPSGAFAIGGGC